MRDEVIERLPDKVGFADAELGGQLLEVAFLRGREAEC